MQAGTVKDLNVIFKADVQGSVEVLNDTVKKLSTDEVKVNVIPRTANVRLLRDNRVIYEGKIASLRHFKNDVSEVRQGFECGIAIERFQDIKIGDVIEAFKVEKLEPALA